MWNLRNQYIKKALPKLQAEFGYKNNLNTPKITKVVVSSGTGEALRDKNLKTVYIDILSKITGQKPQITVAKYSIAGFKIREGMPIGLKVTLRGQRMDDFLTKLIHINLPRVRDFRGLSKKSFDGNGNLNIGIGEFAIFPEVSETSKADKLFGLQVTVVTTAKNDEEGYVLCKSLGFPLK